MDFYSKRGSSSKSDNKVNSPSVISVANKSFQSAYWPAQKARNKSVHCRPGLSRGTVSSTVYSKCSESALLHYLSQNIIVGCGV